MRINFILPPCELSGGPLAIMEYANGFAKRGHTVTITTYPSQFWPNSWNKKSEPFPWFNDFKGSYVYHRSSKIESLIYKVVTRLFLFAGGNKRTKVEAGMLPILDMLLTNSYLIGYMPDCDMNIATYWSTVFASFFSKKGRCVYFMQHYEEVFFPVDFSFAMLRLLARVSYEIPSYKIANSSWLQAVIEDRYKQHVPFSNNALDLNCFGPHEKLSASDGVIRIMTFSRPEEWKGFADVAAAMKIVKKKYGENIEWHVFGREHSFIKPDNEACPYIIHTNIPFKELACLYAQCDMTVCGSWYESFPLPPLESMASGTAVITTTFGVEDYCVDGQNCILVNSRDINALANAIDRLINDKELRDRLAAGGLKTAQDYNWDNAVDMRERLLKAIEAGDTSYNRFKPLNLGFTDFSNTEFEKMPEDLAQKYKNGMLISYNGMIFKIENNAKRHIANEELFKLIASPGMKVEPIPALDFARIPHGFPILTEFDV